MTHDELRKTASEAVRKALIQPMCCMQGSGCEFPPCHCSTVAADAVLAAVFEALREPDAGMLKAAHEAEADDASIGVYADTIRANNNRLFASTWQAQLAASPLRPAASAEGVG